MALVLPAKTCRQSFPYSLIGSRASIGHALCRRILIGAMRQALQDGAPMQNIMPRRSQGGSNILRLAYVSANSSASGFLTPANCVGWRQPTATTTQHCNKSGLLL